MPCCSTLGTPFQHHPRVEGFAQFSCFQLSVIDWTKIVAPAGQQPQLLAPPTRTLEGIGSSTPNQQHTRARGLGIFGHIFSEESSLGPLSEIRARPQEDRGRPSQRPKREGPRNIGEPRNP